MSGSLSAGTDRKRPHPARNRKFPPSYEGPRGLGSGDGALRQAGASTAPASLDAVVAALTDRARRRTPDLALRLLLRAIECASDASLSREQYSRLEAIGSALRYGDQTT